MHSHVHRGCRYESDDQNSINSNPTNYPIHRTENMKRIQNLKGMMPPQKLDEDVDDLSLMSHSSRSVSMNRTSPSDKLNANAYDDRESELAQQETKLVKRSKCLVLFILLTAAAGCGAGKLCCRARTENK
jgi:hypothetical protein